MATTRQAVRQTWRFDRLPRGRSHIALFLDHQMGNHDLIGLPQCRHHVRGLVVVERVETAARRLAVNGDRGQTDGRGRRLARHGVQPKRRRERCRIDPRKIGCNPV